MLKRLLASAILVASVGLAYAGDYGYQQPFLNVTGTNQIDGVSVNPNTAAAGNFTTLAASGNASLTGGINPLDDHAAVFTSTLTGNPLIQYSSQTVLASNVNTPSVILASVTNRKIFVTSPISLMASGVTVSGASSVALVCSGGNPIETFASINLVANVPVVFNSTGTTFASAYSNGCPAGQAVLISDTGTLVSSPSLVVGLQYTVQ